MKHATRPIILAAGLLFMVVAPLLAGDVYLKNGNHLSGAIVSMSEGKLVLETDFAGRLTIDWNHVEQLSTDAPLTVVMEEGATLIGIARPSTVPNRLLLNGESILDPLMIELSKVKAINPPDERPVKLSGRINVGLNKTSGNTDLENAHVDLEFLARTVSHRVTLGGAYNRSSEDSRKTEDNAMGRLKHDYFLTRELYWYLKGMVERDDFKEISLRTTLGPGVGYQFFEGELMNLSVEAGPSYVYTNYAGGGQDDSVSGRWGVKFDRFFFEKLFQYYFTNEGYISASDTSDVFMYTKTGLRFPLRSGFSVNAGFEWDWDNQPAEDTNKSDYRYILSLGYGF